MGLFANGLEDVAWILLAAQLTYEEACLNRRERRPLLDWNRDALPELSAYRYLDRRVTLKEDLAEWLEELRHIHCEMS